MDIYAKLFADPEAEVRSICCIRLKSVSTVIAKEDCLDTVLSQVLNLTNEPVGFVKSTLAAHLLSTCAIVGKSKTNDYIFPVFLSLIKDNDHSIRLTLLKTIDNMNEVISIDTYISTVIPYIKDLSESKSWRVKIEVTDIIPALARNMVII